MMPDHVVEGPGTPMSTDAQDVSMPGEPLPRPKGRMRILKSLQRISSSPSLARLGRGPTTGYRGGHKGSISCVSLSSATSTNAYGHPYGTTTSSWSSADPSPAPTSAASVIGVETTASDTLNKTPSCIRVVEIDPTSGIAPVTSSCPVPARLRANSRGQPLNVAPRISESPEDPVKTAVPTQATPEVTKRETSNGWAGLPVELRTKILRCLAPREIVRCSLVCRAWHRLCFDGQLWRSLDASSFYRDISADALTKIITAAGPFVRDLNLRGCIQFQSNPKAEKLVEACRNLEHVSLEGSYMGRRAVHHLIQHNPRLRHLDLTGLAACWNATGHELGQHCPNLRYLNVSWCPNMDARGVRKVIDGCPELEDLRVSEIRGFDDQELMRRLFEINRLQRLIMNGCVSLTNDALRVLMEGVDPEICPLTSRPMVAPRQLRHLDLSRCHRLTDVGLRKLAHQVPHLEGLQLGGCVELTDDALLDLLPTVPKLTHLDLEELHHLTNATLQRLAEAPCRAALEHLSISYCEGLGDTGMLPVLKACTRIRHIDMDNTRVSDLVLAEAAAMVLQRSRPVIAPSPPDRPYLGLRMVMYDCQNVTWTGVREVLSRNAEVRRATSPQAAPSFPTEIIQLKCFYGWQQTVDEHTKRVMRGDFVAASRLERKWAEFMMSNEEAGAIGAGGRRRRRRAREAAMMHADEEEGGVVPGGIGRRRRARSNGCVVM
ncbi:MAG: hypothetical protein M1823_005391 [Watsoniomyces obsoletus]|nr:MAG: hypothetical protein M1823_005391 [Watsoniomyces obsoletus]